MTSPSNNSRSDGKRKIVYSPVNIREEYDILSGIGWEWIGLRQADKNNKSTADRSSSSGYQLTDFLLKARVEQYSPGFVFQSGIGKMSTGRIKVFVQHDRPINEGDYILLLSSNSETGNLEQPIKIRKTFIVSSSVSKTGKNGRVEFWQIIADERNTIED